MRILTLTAFIFVFALAGCTTPEIPLIPSTIEGSGTPAVEERAVSDFDHIAFAGEGALIVTQDGTESLSVEADDNIMSALETEVQDGTLYIKTSNNTNLRPVTPIRYILSVTNLAELTLSGDGAVTSGALTGDDLQIGITGDGSIALDAVTTSATFATSIEGDGSITAESVETNIASINIPGDGNVAINALTGQTLNVSSGGNGNILVSGSTTKQSIMISGDGIVVADELSSNSATIDISGDGDVTLWVAETLAVTISGDGKVSYYGSPEVSETITGDGKVEGLGEK